MLSSTTTFLLASIATLAVHAAPIDTSSAPPFLSTRDVSVLRRGQNPDNFGNSNDFSNSNEFNDSNDSNEIVELREEIEFEEELQSEGSNELNEELFEEDEEEGAD